MKTELAQEWVSRLRSGDYKQGRGALCVLDEQGNESFCCLGVLCDIMADRDLGVWMDPEEGYLDEPSRITKAFSFMGRDTWAGAPGRAMNMYIMGEDPEPYLEALESGGFDDERTEEIAKAFHDKHAANSYGNHYREYGAPYDALPVLNDSAKYTFDQIADLIEKRYLTKEEE